jgi:hypothetical protein
LAVAVAVVVRITIPSAVEAVEAVVVLFKKLSQ